MKKPVMRIKRRRFPRLLLFLIILASYPAWVLGYTWFHVYKSDLKGGRHGPLDAYRHALASAVVSYTFGEKTVEVISLLTERKIDFSSRMDRHNNRVGARIGAQAKSFWEIEDLVSEKVKQGKMGTMDGDRITWLPEYIWRDGRMW